MSTIHTFVDVLQKLNHLLTPRNIRFIGSKYRFLGIPNKNHLFLVRVRACVRVCVRARGVHRSTHAYRIFNNIKHERVYSTPCFIRPPLLQGQSGLIQQVVLCDRLSSSKEIGHMEICQSHVNQSC